MQQQKMNDEYPIVKRIWVAQPRWKNFLKARWLIRAVSNSDISNSDSLIPPERLLGWSHEPFEIYIHKSVVDELEARVKKIEEGLIC